MIPPFDRLLSMVMRSLLRRFQISNTIIKYRHVTCVQTLSMVLLGVWTHGGTLRLYSIIPIKTVR